MVGVVIVAVSVLLGARLFAQADDTISVWTVRHDVAAGTALTPADVAPADVRFSTTGLAQRYLSASRPLPIGSVAGRDLAAGEMLPRSALGGTVAAALVEVPIALPAEAVPAALRSGETVDVWVTAEGTAAQQRAERVLRGVQVLAAPQNASALGPSLTRQVLVGVPVSQESVLPNALAQLSTGTAVLVRRG